MSKLASIRQSRTHSLRAQSARKPRGFALVVALSLMAFILVLLLSLSQLVQLDVSLGTHQANTSKARQNAILGLNTAIGQLQKWAGPDQRVTAEAAILDTDEGTLNIDGVAEQHWVGVWNAIYPVDATNTPISVTETANATLNNYRDISRRSETQANSDPDQTTQVDAGRIIGWLVSNDPNNPQTPQGFDPNGANAVMLAGASTVGEDDPVAAETVSVPRVAITDHRNNTEGYYAYWVSDEGVKARFDQVDPYRRGTLEGTPTPVPNNVNIGSLALLMSQRPGFEHAIELDAIDYDISSRTHSHPALELNDLAGANETQTRQEAFHDITFSSRGVLSNVRLGGLKQDLTPYLAGITPNEPASSYTSVPNSPIADYPAGLSQSSDTAPTWSELRSFYQIKDSYNAGGTITAQTAAGSEYPFGPVLIRAAMEFIPEVINSGTAVAPDFSLNVHVDFQVVLWNPYNERLSMDATEVEYMVSDQAALLYPAFVRDGASLSGGEYPASDIRVIGVSTGDSNKGMSDSGDSFDSLFQHDDFISFRGPAGTHDDNLTGLVFTLPAMTLEPGEVATFSIAGTEDGNEYAAAGVDTELEKGVTGSTVYFPYGNVTGTIAPLANTDPISGDVTWPRFIFRNWESLSPSSSFAQGQIRHLGLRIPIASGGSRDLQDTSGNVTALDSYYSRLYGEPYSRVELNSSHRTGSILVYRPSATSTTWASAGANVDNKFRYLSFMYPATDGPAGSDLDSNLAMFAHRNPLAVHFTRDGLDYSGNGDYAVPGWEASGRYITNASDPWEVSSDSAYFGPSNGSFSGNGLNTVVSAELPQEGIPMASLGYLQHARLAHNDNGPAFQVGNSYPQIRLADRTDLSRTSGASYNQSDAYADVLDTTYLLNDALWDAYFLSTFENPTLINNAAYVPVNSRMTKAKSGNTVSTAQTDDWTNFAAGNLMVDGAFNVNSTSVKAWKAFLGGMSDLRVAVNSGNDSNNQTDRLVSHYVHPEGGLFNGINQADLWNGYRTLTDAELTDLAEQMVEQVKLRGPFLSMSEFVNRRLSDGATGNKGALQAAIDNSIVNDNAIALANTGGNDYITAANADGLPNLFIREAAGAHHYAGTGAWITQGDILQAQGPNMTVRSDTFLIRSYGSYVDPLTDTVVSEAWCEAVVQRMPDPLYRADNNSNLPGYFTPDANVSPNHGRKFEIVSFRWLSKEDI